MKKYNLFRGSLILLVIIFLYSCEKKDKNNLAKIHFDRDTCERCAMLISDREYVVQTRNIKTSKNKKFDDIGCAISWLTSNDNHDKNWQKNTNIWVKDAKNLKWIDAKTAIWTTGNISPMGYNLLAYTKETVIKNKINFKQAIKLIKKRNMENEHARKKHQQ